MSNEEWECTDDEWCEKCTVRNSDGCPMWNCSECKRKIECEKHKAYLRKQPLMAGREE